MLKAVVIYLAAAGFLELEAQATGAPRRGTAFDTFDSVVTAFLAEHKVPGAAVAIVRGDSVVFERGFGVASLDTRLPVNAETLFQPGSSTKMFTATLVSALAADGVLDLRAPAGRYVSGLAPRIARLTAHELLSQSSGLKDEPGGNGTHDEAALAAYARSWTDAYAILPAGTAFSYSNQGYALAGLLAQEVAKKPFADVMQERVFGPLGMRRSAYGPEVALTSPAAAAHASPPGALPNADPQVVKQHANDTRLWPAGYAYTNVREFARFLTALLNEGMIEGRRALPAQAVAAMMTRYVEVPNIFDRAGSGYGLFVGPYRGSTAFWHDGQMDGFSAYVRMIPEKRLGVVALLNRSGVRMERIADAAFDALGVVATSRTAAESRAPIPMAVAEMQQYVGHYENRFPVEITLRDGALYRTWFGQQQRVYKIGDQRFTVDSARTNRASEFGMSPAAPGRPAYVHVALWAFARTAGR